MSRISYFLLIVALCCSFEHVRAGTRSHHSKRRLQERLCAADSQYCEGLVIAHDEVGNTEGLKTSKNDGGPDALLEKQPDGEVSGEDNEDDSDGDENASENKDLAEGSNEVEERARRRRNNNNVRRRNRIINFRRRGNKRNRRANVRFQRGRIVRSDRKGKL